MKDYYKMEAGVTKYNKVHICIFEILAYTGCHNRKMVLVEHRHPYLSNMGGGVWDPVFLAPTLGSNPMRLYPNLAGQTNLKLT